MTTIRKPAGWYANTLEELMACEAGQAYVVNQLGFELQPDEVFRSSHSSECSYELFADGSLWCINGAEDIVVVDASDWALTELQFDGLWWEDSDDRDGLMIDDMDRELIIHLWGVDVARETFRDKGGRLS
jgi:hypothetical protein